MENYCVNITLSVESKEKRDFNSCLQAFIILSEIYVHSIRRHIHISIVFVKHIKAFTEEEEEGVFIFSKTYLHFITNEAQFSLWLMPSKHIKAFTVSLA